VTVYSIHAINATPYWRHQIDLLGWVYKNRVSLPAPINALFLTQSLQIIVVILRYFSDNGGEEDGRGEGRWAGPVNENVQNETMSLPPVLFYCETGPYRDKRDKTRRRCEDMPLTKNRAFIMAAQSARRLSEPALSAATGPDNKRGAIEALLALNKYYRENPWLAPFDATTHRLHLGDAHALSWIPDGWTMGTPLKY
jgi:hypothetical protein